MNLPFLLPHLDSINSLLSVNLIRYETPIEYPPADIYFMRLIAAKGEVAVQKIIIH